VRLINIRPTLLFSFCPPDKDACPLRLYYSTFCKITGSINVINKSDRYVCTFPCILDLYFNVTFKYRGTDLFPVIHEWTIFLKKENFSFEKISRKFLLCRFKSKIYNVQKMSVVPLIEIFQQFMIAIFLHRIKITMENAIKISNFVSDYRKQVDRRLSHICRGRLQRLDILLHNISDRISST